ncbi:MAG TPA: hypothetical protein VGL66_16790 [Caulobacteraceae bacterium]|jgi:hypothetical protein
MTLSDLASIGSLLSAAAVAVSLVYLALQVRQTEKNQRALVQQGRAERVSRAVFELAQADYAAVYHKGARTPQTLTAPELDRFLMICRAAFLSAEDSFIQHKAGLMDETSYASFVAGAHANFAAPGFRAAWRMLHPYFGAAFVAFIDAIIAERPLPPAASDPMTRWKAALDTLGIGAGVAPTAP